MARPYPRFIYSDPKNTKSGGPFIVHTLPPQMIAKVNFNEDGFHQLETLSVFSPANDQEVDDVVYQMHRWLTAQRMEESKLSPDFYIRTSDISMRVHRLGFFDHLSTGMTFKPLMGSKLEVGKGDRKVEIAYCDEDTYYSTVRKLKEAYREKFGLLPDWPI